LAKFLGDLTEELAAGLKSEIVAGLLNATFGNAVEMVITVQTLRQGLYNVVKATLLGSVLSNVLLVLGMSFFFGGIVNLKGQKSEEKENNRLDGEISMDSTYGLLAAEKVQHFGVLGAMVNTSMLLLSCLSFTLVTVFASMMDHSTGAAKILEDDHLIRISRTCSCIIMSAYIAYVIFQLFTHRTVMGDGDAADEPDAAEEEQHVSVATASVFLCIITALVAISSELLVGAIDGITANAHMGEHFIGIILLPIVGNACEHAAAVRFAMLDKPSLSIGIAVGSSTQIALFVVPFAVLIGWAIDRPMDLMFGALNTTVMTLSVIVVLSMVVDGQSNWLQGYLLMAAYAVVGVLYWYVPDASS
jgi:Ca2+:H+ antiporter